MARYQVKDPSGNMHIIEGPDNATPEQIMAQAQALIPPEPSTTEKVWNGVKKGWDVLGYPERGLQGAASLIEDGDKALYRAATTGQMPTLSGAQESLQNASDVVQGTQAPPAAAGFVAGMLDPRALAIGEAVNPIAKGVVSSLASKAGPVADWLGSRVLQFSKKMVGNQFARSMADAASDYATKAHPEIQQAIMDVMPDASSGAAKDFASLAEHVPPSETSIVPRGATAPEEPEIAGELTSGAKALPSGAKLLKPGTIELPGEGESTLKMTRFDKSARAGRTIPSGDAIEMPGETPINSALSTETSEGPVLEGDVVSGPEGAEYDPEAPVGESSEEGMAPEGIDVHSRPTISAGVGTDDMYQHVGEQLKSVGGAIETTLKGLTDSGEYFDPKPVIKQLESMFKRNPSGSVIESSDLSSQGEFNRAVNRVINTIKNVVADKEGNYQPIPWEDANSIKGAIQDLANYQKPKFSPENMVYSSSGQAIRDAIDGQAAKVMAKNGKDITSFQALRDAYSKLKVLEESLNNKYAGELSAKSAIPVLRTASAGALLTSGKPLPAAMMMGDYLVRKYGPQAGAQIMRAMADNAGGLGAAAGNTGRVMSAGASGIAQGLQGD